MLQDGGGNPCFFLLCTYQSCLRTKPASYSSIKKLHCHTVCLREAPFVLRRLTSQPQQKPQASERDMCGPHCGLRVCPQGFSHMLFRLPKSSVPTTQKGSNTGALAVAQSQQTSGQQRGPLCLHGSGSSPNQKPLPKGRGCMVARTCVHAVSSASCK